jgi:XRE family transcriptional regulator, regulator of sulfur utilization
MPSHDGALSSEHRHLGAAVREFRERHGAGLPELAERAGLRPSELATIERAEVDPSFLTLARLARAASAPLSELLELYDRNRGRGDG